MEKPTLEALFDELLAYQEEKLLSCATSIVPQATSDDILQPNDFPKLENHPFFRYEEGILDGFQVVRAASNASEKD